MTAEIFHRSARGDQAAWAPQNPRFVLLGLAAVVGLAVNEFLGSSSSDLPVVTLICLPIQVFTVVQLRRNVVKRSMALSVGFGMAWLVYFTLRLILTQLDRNNVNEQSVVLAAGDDAFVWAWIVTTIGLVAFAAGVTIAGAGKPSAKFLPDLNIDTLFWFGTVGLGGRAVMVFGGINSGFIENIVSLYLLAFAALGFHSVSLPAVRRRLYVLVAFASMLGVLTSFKEAAIVPIAALALGIAAAGLRVAGTRKVMLVAAGLLVFLTIQGSRIAFDEGDEISIIEAPLVGFTTYDFEAGVTAEPDRSFLEVNLQIAKGMSRRFGGVSSIVILHEKVPAETPFLGGDSLWQPALSAVPVVSGYFDLDFAILSLGRYFTQTFVAPDQPDNPSSQAITMLGDFYLNFGEAGILVGFLLWGIMVGKLDRLFVPTSATRVGAVAYLGHVLIGIERNVAFLGVNTAIRVTVLLLVLRGVARWGTYEPLTAQRTAPARH